MSIYKDAVISEMKHVFAEMPHGVSHTLQVLSDAEAIMDGEGISGDLRQLTELVVILHDIGVVQALAKHGSADAQYQELEGPEVAMNILTKVGFAQHDPKGAERICYIVGHHHTQQAIDGTDFQVQWEADMLVNLEYMDVRKDREKLPAFIDENFKTATGKKMAIARFCTVE